MNFKLLRDPGPLPPASLTISNLSKEISVVELLQSTSSQFSHGHSSLFNENNLQLKLAQDCSNKIHNKTVPYIQKKKQRKF